MSLISLVVGVFLAILAGGLVRQSLIFRRLQNWRYCISTAFFGLAAMIGSVLTFADLFGWIR